MPTTSEIVEVALKVDTEGNWVLDKRFAEMVGAHFSKPVRVQELNLALGGHHWRLQRYRYNPAGGGVCWAYACNPNRSDGGRGRRNQPQCTCERGALASTGSFHAASCPSWDFAAAPKLRSLLTDHVADSEPTSPNQPVKRRAAQTPADDQPLRDAEAAARKRTTGAADIEAQRRDRDVLRLEADKEQLVAKVAALEANIEADKERHAARDARVEALEADNLQLEADKEKLRRANVKLSNDARRNINIFSERLSIMELDADDDEPPTPGLPRDDEKRDTKMLVRLRAEIESRSSTLSELEVMVSQKRTELESTQARLRAADSTLLERNDEIADADARRAQSLQREALEAASWDNIQKKLRLGLEKIVEKAPKAKDVIDTFIDEEGMPMPFDVAAEICKLGELGESVNRLSDLIGTLVSSSARDKLIRRLDNAVTKNVKKLRLNYAKSGDGKYKYPEVLREDLDAALEAARRKKDLGVLTQVAVAVQNESGGRHVTHLGFLITFTLLFLGNITHYANGAMSMLNLSASYTAVYRWRTLVVDRIGRTWPSNLAKFVWGACSALFVFDNKAFLQFERHPDGAAFTRCISTITMLLWPIPKDPDGVCNLSTDPDRLPAMAPVNDPAFVPRIREFYKTYKHSILPQKHTMAVDTSGIDILGRATFPKVDPHPEHARLGDFFVLPSLEAKSSSLAHLLHIIISTITVTSILVGLCHFDRVVLVDPEPFLLYDLLSVVTVVNGVAETVRFYGACANTIVCLSVFHLQKHLLESSLCDVLNCVQIWASIFIKCNYRVDAMAKVQSDKKAVARDLHDELAHDELGQDAEAAAAAYDQGIVEVMSRALGVDGVPDQQEAQAGDEDFAVPFEAETISTDQDPSTSRPSGIVEANEMSILAAVAVINESDKQEDDETGKGDAGPLSRGAYTPAA